MYISHLSLANFRNYTSLDIDLPAGSVVLCGDNAQGKTNLLEAVYLLATSKSPRASADREMVNCRSVGDILPFARLCAEVKRGDGASRVEVTLTGQQGGDDSTAARYQKKIKVNGAARNAAGLIGVIRVVMFDPRDVDIVGGSPALRRRYMDATNAQVDPLYLRNFQRYSKVITQRNHLLRMIKEHRSGPAELAFWDEQLIETGSYIIQKRRLSIDAIDAAAEVIHRELTGSAEDLQISYTSNVVEQQQTDLKKTFSERLEKMRRQEIARGMSLVGPHRDDLSFSVGDINMCTYGSRGQHRTIALSLKMAQAGYIERVTGDGPVLLLDDVLSELDADRRRHLLHSVASYQQALITATDWDHFDADFYAKSTRFQVQNGTLKSV